MADYTDLLTFSDLDSAALDSVDNLSSIAPQAEDVISEVTSLIESYLDRSLIVRKHTMLHEDIDYRYDAAVSTDATTHYSWYAGNWPIVEVNSVTPSGFTISVHPDERRLYTDFDGDDQPIRQIDYFAGYKRSDQTLSDLQGESELSGLTTAPDDLPRDIRSVAARLAVHLIKEMKQGVGRRTVQTTGPVQATVEGAERGFVQKELRKLDTYRSLAF